jgi:hypothetical protein
MGGIECPLRAKGKSFPYTRRCLLTENLFRVRTKALLADVRSTNASGGLRKIRGGNMTIAMMPYDCDLIFSATVTAVLTENIELPFVEVSKPVRSRAVKARGHAAIMAKSFQRRTVRKLTWA